MHTSRRSLLLVSPALAAACFQPGAPSDIATGDGSGSESSSDGHAPPPDPSGPSSASSTSGEGPEGSSGLPPADEGSTTTTTATTSSGSDDGTTTGAAPCDPLGPAGLPGVNPHAIWIANTTESTLSKLDTVSMIEVGRYLTRADGVGSPSRTAVSLSGDVVVANRNSGLTKIHGDPSTCPDANRDGSITTSSGSEVLPWPDEECRAWYTPFDYTSHRPVAWTAGEIDEATCERVDEKIWTAGVLAATTIEVALVDGETGTIEQTVQIPELPADAGAQTAPLGFYGGAVGPDGDFWISMVDVGYLARIDRETLAYDYWPLPIAGYGMTYGASGYVFTCSAAGVSRFEPVTETWVTAPNVGGSGGCVEDDQSRLWLANDPMVALDVQTLVTLATIDLPEYVHGVAFDFEGNLWGVGHVPSSTNAYRIDPTTGSFSLFGGLVGPYTYSDMTGFALANVASP
jgi:hypothetical protein